MDRFNHFPEGSMILKNKEFREDVANTLGGRIIYAREQQGLSTAQLARRLGIESTTLQEWESDRAQPRANRLTTLASMLNVSPTWLLMSVGERPSDTLDETEMMQIRGTVERLRKQTIGIASELEQLEERLDSYESYQK